MAVPPTIPLVVSNISGESFGVDVVAGQKVSDLKGKITEHWHIPQACQKLVVGAKILQDIDSVDGDWQPGDQTKTVTLIVTLEDITRDFNHRESGRRSLALNHLKELGPKGGEATLTAWSELLEHPRSVMRRTAVAELASLAQKGDERIYAEVAARLGDSSAAVRLAAVRAIQVVVEKGSQHAVDALITCLQDRYEYPGVRLAAVEALAEVAEKGDSSAITALIKAFKDDDADVRWKALSVITEMVENGSAPIHAAVSACLEDVEAQVRHAAVRAIVDLAETNECAIASLGAHQNDPDPRVQQLIDRTLEEMTMRILNNRVSRVSERGVVSL